MILNLFGKKEVAEFKKEFHEKEFEMLVLTMEESACIGIVRGNYLQSSVQFAASINLENGEFSEKTGRLEYLNKRNNERKVAYNIEKHKIEKNRIEINMLHVARGNTGFWGFQSCVCTCIYINHEVSWLVAQNIEKTMSQDMLISNCITFIRKNYCTAQGTILSDLW